MVFTMPPPLRRDVGYRIVIARGIHVFAVRARRRGHWRDYIPAARFAIRQSRLEPIPSARAQAFALRNARVREIDLLFVWHFAIDYECGEGVQGLLETGVGCFTGMLRGTYQLHMPLL